ncbi:hypothetical protein KFL_000610090 [Klebsormidium nitens]|uniref:Uncharacterized protein n=1 Tax=Klebsormidium nitens TaxID=105231 RepID=A0A0U9HQL3_KLENI|nr:hypothetical protein KFL_000610090 [Klebsormidium nitens]|eukprot:GAQ80731.1 hypothetical protein KFL_000610090 [Klebsormidium nitens]
MGSDVCAPFRPVVFYDPAGLSSGPAKVLPRDPLPLPALVQHRRWLAARDRELQQQRKDAAEPKTDGVANFSSRLRTKIREGKGDLGFWRAARNSRALKARQESLPGRAHSVLERVANADVVDHGEAGSDAYSRRVAASARAQSVCSFHHREVSILETTEDTVQVDHVWREFISGSSKAEKASTSSSAGEGKGATPKRPFRRRRGEKDSDSQETLGSEKENKVGASGLNSRKGARPKSAGDWKRRPKWALTEEDVDALDAEEADRLLDFVLGLDFSSFCEKADGDLRKSIERVELEASEAEERPEVPPENDVDKSENQPASSTSVPDGRCDRPSLSSAGEDTWTLAAALWRQERPVLGVHSTASIKTLIEQGRPRTPAA